MLKLAVEPPLDCEEAHQHTGQGPNGLHPIHIPRLSAR